MSQPPLILVCDDSQNIARLIEVVLQGCGYRVQVVHSALDAVAAARQEAPALLIMDIMMPGMDGATASDHMRYHAELSGIPIVLLSAMTEEEVRSKAEATGAAGWLTKPFKKAMLLGMAARIVGAPAVRA
jgi:CheY-like chemotaxis protein